MLSLEDIKNKIKCTATRILHEKEIIGNSQITGYLGSGRFSEVYGKTNGTVIKLFDDIDSFEYYQNEAKMLLTLMNIGEHVNIIKCYGVGVHQEFRPDFSPRVYPYIILERADYELSKLLKITKLDPAVAKQLSFDVSKGLAFCHQNNVVHADLKPHNVLIFGDISRQHNLRAKLCDFGSSFIIPDIFTTHPGTYEYLPPECVPCETECMYSKPFDIWCLMCTIFEIFTSEKLFNLSTFLGSSESSECEDISGIDEQSSSIDESDEQTSEDEDDPEMLTELLYQIENYIGRPPKSVTKKMRKYYNSKGKLLLSTQHVELPNLGDLLKIYTVDHSRLKDLLLLGLKWIPDERITIESFIKFIE